MTRYERFGLRDVDVEDVVRSHAITYEDAATCWQDGHILGNGDVGAVAYAPYWLEWTVNKIDVFDSRTAPRKKLSYAEVMAEVRKRKAKNLRFLDEIEKPDTRRSPLEPLLKSCGQIKVRTRANEYSWGAPRPYRIRQVLSLFEATNHMEIQPPRSERGTPGGARSNRPARVWSFVDRDSNLLVVRMRGSSGALLREKKLELCRPADYDLEPPVFGSAGNVIWFTQKLPDGSSYAMVMGANAIDNKHCRDAGLKPSIGSAEKGDRIWFNLTGDFDLFVAVATSHESSDPLSAARKTVRKGMNDGGNRLQERHHRWWAEFWKKSFVQLEAHPMLEQCWYMGLYELGSSLGRAPVPGLNGLWHGHQDLPVQGFFWAVYTLDQNVQLHTMPVFAANHPELALPFMDTFLDMLPRTIRETRKEFDLPGACFKLEMGFLGGEPSYHSSYRYTFCGGPFCGILFAWSYLYTRDRRLLKERIYPFLREIVRFFVAFMDMGEDGHYHLRPTVPAEISTLSRDAIADISLLKPCLRLAIEASELFDVDADERVTWKHVLAQYPPYPVKKGIIVDGADISLDHPSLYTYRLYPLVFGHEQDAEVRQFVRSTLKHVTPSFCSSTSGRWDSYGWSWCFFTLAKIMCGDKRDLLPLLYEEIRQQLKPNGLMPHVGMGPETSENPRCRELTVATPENNSAVMMVITEMLMQSENGVIRLFPGLHGKATARFGKLRAEGAFLVSAEMDKGVVRFVSITAEHEGTTHLVNPWKDKTVTLVCAPRTQERIQGRTIALTLKRGETVHLYSMGKPRVREIRALHPPGPKIRTFADGTVVSLGKSSTQPEARAIRDTFLKA